VILIYTLTQSNVTLMRGPAAIVLAEKQGGLHNTSVYVCTLECIYCLTQLCWIYIQMSRNLCHKLLLVIPPPLIKQKSSYQHTNLLTPWCRVLPEQLTGLQLVKKFPAFHVTRRFITALTSVRHLSLSWASPIQSTCPHPISWRSILILSTHLLLSTWVQK